jgi:hypothetical protein
MADADPQSARKFPDGLAPAAQKTFSRSSGEILSLRHWWETIIMHHPFPEPTDTVLEFNRQEFSRQTGPAMH